MSVVSPAATHDLHGTPAPSAPASARLASLLLAVALALPLLVYAATGAFARYAADDYCWAGVLATRGFLGAQVHWYTAYSPRYAFTFLVNLVELAGPGIVPALPAVALAAWLAALRWGLARLLRRAGWLVVLLLAATVLFATLQTAPDLPQSLYWQTGMLTYSLPLILASLLLGGAAVATRHAADGRPLPRAWLLLAFGLAFVAGGLSETYLIPQNVALTLACAVAVGVRRLGGRPVPLAYLAAALAGGVAALLAILLAPATPSRVGGSPADLWLALSASIATAAALAARLLRHFAPTVLLCLGAGLLLAPWPPAGEGDGARRPPRSLDPGRLGVVTAVVVITLPFCFFPSFFAQNGNPPARSEIVPEFLMVGYLVFLGWSLAPAVARLAVGLPAPARAAALGCLALVPLAGAAFGLPGVADAARYAARWDAEDRQIQAARAAGARALVVPTLPPNFGEDFVGPDPTHWFNGCVARYYGLDSIASTG